MQKHRHQVDVVSMIVVQSIIPVDAVQTAGVPQIDVETGAYLSCAWLEIRSKEFVGECRREPGGCKGSASKIPPNVGSAGRPKGGGSRSAGEGFPCGPDSYRRRTGQSCTPNVRRVLKGDKALLPDRGTAITANGSYRRSVVKSNSCRVVVL